LRECDAEVATAASATEALELLSRFDADVLVSDIGMPQLDGYDLIREIRSRPATADLPAIALTAYACPEERNQALDAGYQAHICKPVDSVALAAAIADLVGGRKCHEHTADGNAATADDARPPRARAGC